jgi:signal transduction histidine kinase
MVFVIRVDDANDDALTTASDHIDDVSDTASAALSALKDAETGQRGFLITGKESYLGPYDAGLRDFDTAMAKLRQLSAAEPELSALISHMADVGAKKRAELSVTIDLFRAKGQAAAFEHVSTGIGKQYMDEIRETAGTVVSVEDAAYDRNRRAAAQAETATHWKSLASVVVLFLLTLMGTLLLSMEIRYERRLAANLEVSEKRYRELAESLEDQVEARTRELQQLNQELTAFSYSVSHDLRAPLRSIDGFSQIVIEDYADKLDDNGRRMLERIRGAAQRMGHLIQSLLDLARVTRQEIDRQSVSISDLAAGAIHHLEALSPERKVDVSIAPGLMAEGDQHLLRVVMDNLLANAWKFTSKTESPRIEVGRVEVEGKPAFFVRDNGAGFDSEHADKLFRPFQRLHSESEFEGTGIGLATVQRIVNRHGGRVWAEGKPGRGATFFFALS